MIRNNCPIKICIPSGWKRVEFLDHVRYGECYCFCEDFLITNEQAVYTSFM